MSKLEEIGARRVESVFLGNLANLYFHHGDLVRAQACYEKANTMFEALEDKLNLAYFRAFYAGLIAEQNRTDEAQEYIDYASKTLQDIGDDLGVEAVYLCEGLILLAEASTAMDSNDIQTANTNLASIHERIENVKKKGPVSKSHPEGAPSLAERSGDIRDALRFVEAALQRYKTKFRVESA